MKIYTTPYVSLDTETGVDHSIEVLQCESVGTRAVLQSLYNDSRATSTGTCLDGYKPRPAQLMASERVNGHLKACTELARNVLVQSCPLRARQSARAQQRIHRIAPKIAQHCSNEARAMYTYNVDLHVRVRVPQTPCHIIVPMCMYCGFHEQDYMYVQNHPARKTRIRRALGMSYHAREATPIKGVVSR